MTAAHRLGYTIPRGYKVDSNSVPGSEECSYLIRWAHLDPGFDPAHYHHDHLGTTRLLSEADGQGGHELFSHLYSAFGQAISEPDPPMTRYGYVGAHGYEADLLTFEGAAGTMAMKLSHVGERWYDPSTGRFIQCDPLGLEGALNAYGYVENNPVLVHDEDGLQAWKPIISLGKWLWKKAKNIRCTKPKFHGPHHSFPLIGKCHHIQMTFYIKGKKGSGWNVRIPIPKKLHDWVK